MTREELKEIGFKEIPHYTVMNSLIFEIGRKRQFSIGSLGTPNEMMFLAEIDVENNKKYSSVIVIHNYDYDGFLTIEKVKALINLIK